MSSASPTLLRMFSAESDPLLIREWLLVATWTYSTYLFFTSGESLTGAVAGAFAFPLLIYGALVSGLLGRSLETGQFGHIWTLPVPRRSSLALRVLGYTGPMILLLLLPILFLATWATFPPSPDGILSAVTLTGSTLLLYISFGTFCAAVTRNGVATSALVFFPFLLLPAYFIESDPSNRILQGTLGSLSVIIQSPAASPVGLATFVGIIVLQVTTSVLLIVAAFSVLRRVDLRSGRA